MKMSKIKNNSYNFRGDCNYALFAIAHNENV